MRHSIKALLGALALVPGVALADASNFSYLEGAYLSGEIADRNVHGWAATGSVALTEQLFVRGAFSDVNLDEDDPDFRFDREQREIGLGFVFGQNPTASVYGTASYIDIRTGTRVGLVRGSTSEDGFDLGLGARINMSPEAEIHLRVNHSEFGRGEELTVPSAEFVYKFTRQIAGKVDYSRKSGNDMMGLGLRFYF